MIKVQKQLLESQKEVTRLTVEASNNITGGDSYCSIALSLIHKDKALVSLGREGKYPLYDVSIRIQRKSEADELGEKIKDAPTSVFLEGYAKITYYFEKKILSAYNTADIIGEIPVVPGVDETYLISFTARNGTWAEEFTFKYNDKGELKTSLKVFRQVSTDGKKNQKFILTTWEDAHFHKAVQ